MTQIANSARVSAQGTQEEITNFPVKIKILGITDAVPVANASVEAEPLDEGMMATGGRTLRPGMSGTVDVFTETVSNAVVVPIQAVTMRDFNRLPEPGEDGDAEDEEENAVPAAPLPEDLRRVVFVLREGQGPRWSRVETGISDDTHIEVLSGLTGGETVITGPFRILRTELEAGETVYSGRERGARRPGEKLARPPPLYPPTLHPSPRV